MFQTSRNSNKEPRRPDYLNQLVANAQLTADGRDWLTLALDPFHDFNHQAAGYPDADGSQTIVSCYQYQIDITKPAGVVGNWDVNIYNMPNAISYVTTAATENANWTLLTGPAAASNAAFGPLCIFSNAAGVGLNPTVPATANAKFQTLPAVGVTDLIEGVTRIIGQGFEVTNTTAEMYKQGAVTVYRMPQYKSEASNTTYSNAAGTLVTNFTAARIRQAPITLAEINSLKGTRTWSAADGVYAVPVQNSIQNPMMAASTLANVYCQTAWPDAGGEPAAFTPINTTAANVGPVPTLVTPSLNQVTPFDTTGAYFTGLSEQTTLTVKYKVYVERAPTHTEANLAVLATPSAGLDEKAMEIYAHVINQLPVAVPVSENGLGDWFRGVLRVIKTVSGGVSGLLGTVVPGAQQIGTGVNMIAGELEKLVRPSNKAVVKVAPKKRPLPKRK